MCVKLSLGDLNPGLCCMNPDLCSLHPISIYTCEVTIAPGGQILLILKK